MTLERICPQCQASFEPATISTKYCPTCAPVVAYERLRERKRRAYAKLKEQREEARRIKELED